MGDHLRFSGKPFEVQREALKEMLRADPVLMAVLAGLREAALPDWLLVAGAIYNQVWNNLTGRAPLTGVNDIDVFYHDASDISYEAEDRVIQALALRFADLPVPVQVRNQARVHLWFPQKFGQSLAPLSSSAEMLSLYASRTHAVAARLEADDTITIHAPFGLDDLFSFRIVPNHALANRATHEAKGARAKSIWPELTLEPW
jgi:hypothetical protein